jgi:hypothetical protein
MELDATDNIATRSLRCWMDANADSPCTGFFSTYHDRKENSRLYFSLQNAGIIFAQRRNCDTQLAVTMAKHDE